VSIFNKIAMNKGFKSLAKILAEHHRKKIIGLNETRQSEFEVSKDVVKITGDEKYNNPTTVGVSR
jgi:hypothetical protein